MGGVGSEMGVMHWDLGHHKGGVLGASHPYETAIVGKWILCWHISTNYISLIVTIDSDT